MAFILAGIVAFLTLALCGAVVFANSMSDAPSQDPVDATPVLITGLVIAAAIAGSHWVHFPSW